MLKWLKLPILTVLILSSLGNLRTNGAKAVSVRSLTVLETAYCLRGTMANGHYVHPGAIAVDPRVIPMGSRIFVPGYGWGTAEDTGGAIIGYHIDVWMSDCSQAMRSTRWNVRIKISR